MFAWKVSVPYNPDWVVHSFVISETPQSASAAVTAEGQVLGGPLRSDHAQGVPRQGEGRRRSSRPTSLARPPTGRPTSPPAVDRWGGLPGSKEKLGLQATGFFRVEKKGDRWLLVNPDGNVTFHLGICVFNYNPGDETTYIEGRREIYEWLPPLDGEFAAAFHPDKWWHDKAFSFYAANVIRKYGTPDEQG